MKTSIPASSIHLFKIQKDWEEWLDQNHTQEEGIWLRFYKKNSDKTSINYAIALEVALCYGWIDSQVNKYDEESYIQKFSPRRSRSIWSKINIGHIERLIKEGRMKEAGMRQVELAKADGRWAAAYDSPKDMKVPEDFLQELEKNTKAKEFFQTLNKTNTFAIAWQIQTAKKPETRERRISKFVEMLSRGEKLY